MAEVAPIVLAIVILCLGVTYFYGGKGAIITIALGCAVALIAVGAMFVGALLGFSEGGIGYEIIVAVYFAMALAVVTPLSYLLLWVLKKLPHQRK